jgi:multicomponent Na+:H+ antiporter subunit A
MAHWLWLGAVAPAVGAILCAMLPDRNRLGTILAAIPFAIFAVLLAAASDPVAVGIVNWVPELGLSFSFRLDGLSRLFALLVSGIGVLVLIYANDYLKDHPERRRFFATLMSFMAAMLGLLLSENLLLAFVFWELTSITSFLLIGFKHESEKARKAAKQGLVVTVGGGLAMLAGIVLIGQVVGSFELSTVLQSGDALRSSPLYGAILACLFAGCFTKSAQWPFHFWLPNAMEAPTPVSAYLHSATMVQAGVYLLARLSPALGGTEAWQTTLMVVGGITILTGAALTLRSRDLKRILAYSTVSALGMLTFLVGMEASHAFAALVLAHALYKGALFLVAGAIDHETGTRDAPSLSGLRTLMPLTASSGTLGALSMAGMFPFLGFVAKELMLHKGEWWQLVSVVVYGAGAVVAAYMVGVRPFLGPRAETHAHEPPVGMWLGPTVLGVLSLLLGLAGLQIGPLLNWELGPSPAKFYPWVFYPLPNVAFALSMTSIALGAILAWRRQEQWKARPDAVPGGWSIGEAFDRGVDASLIGCQWLTRRVQSGYLNRYLRICVVSAVSLILLPIARSGVPDLKLVFTSVHLYEAVICVAICVGAVAAVRSRSRIGSVAALGIVGYGVALIYVLYGAPDLAMTQVAVETLTLLLFVFAFAQLPKITRKGHARNRYVDFGIAAAVALTFGGLALLAAGHQPASSVSDFFTDRSLPEGYGRNVVNVILVDFRALDTLGEITVMGVAAIGVYALLKLRHCKEASS